MASSEEPTMTLDRANDIAEEILNSPPGKIYDDDVVAESMAHVRRLYPDVEEESEEDFYEWVVTVCEHGDLVLLKDVPVEEIKKRINKCVYAVISRDFVDILRYFYDRKILTSFLGVAETASALGAVKIFRFIQKRFSETPLWKHPNFVAKCFTTACSGGHLKMVKYLVHIYPLPEMHSLGLSYSEMSGSDKVSQFLVLQHGVKYDISHRSSLASSR